jgi:hypothetical protein
LPLTWHGWLASDREAQFFILAIRTFLVLTATSTSQSVQAELHIIPLLSSHYLLGRYVVTFFPFLQSYCIAQSSLCTANENALRLANVGLTIEEYGLSQTAQKSNPNLV